jgi:hypothetical protein
MWVSCEFIETLGLNIYDLIIKDPFGQLNRSCDKLTANYCLADIPLSRRPTI